MTLFRLTKNSIEELPQTSLSVHRVRERADLQRLLRTNIDVVARGVLIIAEEFCDWEDSKRRIDLLGIDQDGNLVVIELKRDHDGGHMELQALRYAAMVSTMTFDSAVDVFQRFLDEAGDASDARTRLLDFLGWDQPHEDEFARQVRIVLVAADFRKELTTTVLWLGSECGLDIRCVRLKPYANSEDVILDVQQVLPLPEAEEYQIKVREKAREEREALRQSRGSNQRTGFWFMNVGDADEGRSWDDCRKYGFMSAGGGKQWADAVRRLKPNYPILAYASRAGYVGVGRVTTEAMPIGEFRLPDGKRLLDMPLAHQFTTDGHDDPEQAEWCVGVQWLAAVERERGVHRSYAYRGTVNEIYRKDVVEAVLGALGVEPTAIPDAPGSQ